MDEIKKAINAALKPLPDVAAIRAPLEPSPHMNALLATLEPLPHMKALQAALEPLPHMKALQAALEPSPHMKALQAALEPSPHMKALQAALEPSPHMKALLAALEPSPQIKAMQAALQPLPQMPAIRALLDAIPKMSAVQAALEPSPTMTAIQAALMPLPFHSIKALPSMLALGASMGAVGLHSATTGGWWPTDVSSGLLDAVQSAGHLFIEDSIKQSHLTELITQLIYEVDSDQTVDVEANQAQAIGHELSEAASKGDLSQLSNTAKTYMLWLCGLIAALYVAIANAGAVREEICFWQPKILPGMTSGQIGKAIRRAACNVPLEVLRDFRFVRGDGVQLRETPSMKGRVLPVSLFDGHLLEVISSDNRDWLHVAVVGQKGTEGWISRRYAKPLVH